MKKILTFIVTAILCVGACFCAVGCDGCNKQGGNGQYVNPRNGQITVGITNAAPMNYKNAEGQWIGFDTDLAIMTFNALGYEVMFKEIAWSSKYSELNGGTIDCIWNGFTANSSDTIDGVVTPRSELVAMSRDYMINEQCIVKNVNVTFEKIEAPTEEESMALTAAQFQGQIIAFESGSSGDAGVGYLAEDYADVSFISRGLTSQADAITQVNTGNAQFAIVDRSIAEAKLGEESSFPNIEIVSPDVFDYFGIEFYAIGFKNDNDGAALRNKVDQVLQLFYDIGYLETLCTKYKIDFASRVQPLFEAE